MSCYYGGSKGEILSERTGKMVENIRIVPKRIFWKKTTYNPKDYKKLLVSEMYHGFFGGKKGDELFAISVYTDEHLIDLKEWAKEETKKNNDLQFNLDALNGDIYPPILNVDIVVPEPTKYRLFLSGLFDQGNTPMYFNSLRSAKRYVVKLIHQKINLIVDDLLTIAAKIDPIKKD
jgi:hypothetical protein